MQVMGLNNHLLPFHAQPGNEKDLYNQNLPNTLDAIHDRPTNVKVKNNDHCNSET